VLLTNVNAFLGKDIKYKYGRAGGPNYQIIVIASYDHDTVRQVSLS
jgi:hypothetical protein